MGGEVELSMHDEMCRDMAMAYLRSRGVVRTVDIYTLDTGEVRIDAVIRRLLDAKDYETACLVISMLKDARELAEIWTAANDGACLGCGKKDC